eukprot:3155833-Amphidinium_carterae.1
MKDSAPQHNKVREGLVRGLAWFTRVASCLVVRSWGSSLRLTVDGYGPLLCRVRSMIALP